MSKYLISLILLSVISMDVSAQRITRQYNNVSFSAALKDFKINNPRTAWKSGSGIYCI